MMSPELIVAEEAARAGGAILKKYFHEGVEIRNKDVANLVSDADIEAERAIVAAIRRTYPRHEVLGEEVYQGDVGAEHLWIIDPLDGTNNFAHKIAHFAVSIAYYRGGQPVCGLIYNPIIDDWYTALRGAGALHNGRQAQVVANTSLSEIVVGVGFPYERGVMMESTLATIGDLIRREIHGIRRFGTASLDFCMVGLGMFGAYFEYQLSPWDFAAGRLFVEEAGGRVTTARGEPLSLAKSSILASNGALHEVTLEVIRPHHPPVEGSAS